MTAPYFPPPKSLDGITLRETLSYERTVDDGGEVPTPGGTTPPPVIPLPIADGSDVTVIVEQPADPLCPWPAQRPQYDSTGQTEIRVIADIEDAGAVDAVGYPEYSADGGENFAAPTGDGPFVPLGEVGSFASGWRPLIQAARADVVWRGMVKDGDGAATPAIGKFHIQFRLAPLPPMTRWYWRTGAPEDAPSFDPEAVAWGDFWSRVPRADFDQWLTPEPADVQAAAGRLLKTKGAAATSITTTTTPTGNNVEGPVLRFVSPPLAAQTITGFRYRSMFVGSTPGGALAAYGNVLISIWRPSTDEVVATGNQPNADGLWFRSIARARVVDSYWVPLDADGDEIEGFATEAGDRIVLDVGGGLATATGILGTEGYGVTLGYNGTIDNYVGTELIADSPEGGTASYLDLPSSILFTSEVA